jgi:hypothetical protein
MELVINPLKRTQEVADENGVVTKELMRQISLKSQLLDLFTSPTFVNLANVSI